MTTISIPYEPEDQLEYHLEMAHMDEYENGAEVVSCFMELKDE